jgi:uncharacterized protein YeaO (DUF488 family)
VGAIELRRVYDDEPATGQSFLVERLWPRGISRERLSSAQWCKDVAPSHELRKWFGHDPERYEGFRIRYRAELHENRAAAEPLLTAAAKGDVLLLFDAKDTEHNQAVVLAEWLRQSQ